MKTKYILPIALLLLVGFTILVSAVVFEINPQKSNTLNSGNSVCEYYQNEFSNGEQETITINGASVNVEYLGDKNWKVNDYEGKLKNHDFFTYNQDSKLKGIRFDFSYMGDYQPDGNFGLTEQDYYPWDCQGYSQSTGMISEIKINEGWNMVPWDISLRDCYNALNGELCKDDVLISYYYIPPLNKYFTEEELEKEYESNSILKEYFSEDNEFTLQKSSKWIYVKPGAGNKKVIGHFGAHIPYRNQYLDNNAYRLRSGWNFLFIDAFMVYDDTWSENPMSFSDFSGSCNIENVYLWDFFEQDWMKITGEIDDDIVGYGIIIKVTDDCSFGYSTIGDGTTPPQLPGGNNSGGVI